MKTIISIFLVLSGCFLVIFGLSLARFFYEFPVIPGILSVTFWGDAIAFAVVAVLGCALLISGIVRLTNSLKK